ncbi:unnamed protein product [Gordionus sp. m RMFG-2023]|uniref:actin-related protein 2/3 complex subunit 4-like n=1 Tax=Gordionus sp. m RMFG-2023 TaxID=3053472 RepID=UPI0030E1DF70
MALSSIPYLKAVETTLTACLCITNFPSEYVEKHDKPEIETQYSLEIIAPNPMIVTKNEKERVKFEVSFNSIRLSILVKQSDDVEKILCRRFMRHMMLRASTDFPVLRKKVAHSDYSITFLLTNKHMIDYNKRKLVDFIIYFMAEVDKDINEMKISLNSRARLCAEEFLKMF